MTLAARRRDSVMAVPPVEALLLALLAGQRELVDEMKGLRADLASNRSSGTVAHEKPISDLISVLAASVADKAFSAREVIERAAVLDVPLCAALTAAGLENPRQLGKWLRRVEGRERAGVRIERIGTDHDGIVWRVWRV